MAVEHSFGGPESKEKAEWMVFAIDTWFKENGMAMTKLYLLNTPGESLKKYCNVLTHHVTVLFFQCGQSKIKNVYIC